MIATIASTTTSTLAIAVTMPITKCSKSHAAISRTRPATTVRPSEREDDDSFIAQGYRVRRAHDPLASGQRTTRAARVRRGRAGAIERSVVRTDREPRLGRYGARARCEQRRSRIPIERIHARIYHGGH